MATKGTINEKFEVKVIRETVVKAAVVDSLPPENNQVVLRLSNLDLLSGRFPVTYIYFYNSTIRAGGSLESISETLRGSLAECLVHFYPFAGRIRENELSREPEIVCDNSGALVVEAQASIALKELDFYNLNDCLMGKLVAFISHFPVQVQITSYACGGAALAFTFDHALGDAAAFGKFLVTWSQIAMKRPLTCSPDHTRNLHARFPPRYDPSMDEAFVSCTMEDIQTIPTIGTLVKRLYYIDESSINALQKVASKNGSKRTKIEALSAYVWKVMAGAIPDNQKYCKLGWLIDGRTRLSTRENTMSDYIGNVLSLSFGKANIADLLQGSIAEIANRAHRAIAMATNEEHFRGLIDWVECHRPGLMLSRNVLGQGGPTIVISSGRRFPVAELEFGFGNPVLGTACSTIERLGVGYMNQRQSANGDGSWIVSAILWPEMVAALESDPDRIFEPMDVSHVRLERH